MATEKLNLTFYDSGWEAGLDLSDAGIQVTLVDARVQGPDAERTLIVGLEAAAVAGLDVVGLVRGGGSRTDLAAFDGEAVARAIATAPLPVLTGIGHEIDDTVADRVAHTAYKTPTACAAGLVAIVRSYVEAAEAVWSRVREASTTDVQRAADRIDEHSRRLLRSTAGAVALSRMTLADAERRLLREAGQVADQAAAAASSSRERLVLAARRIPAAAHRELEFAAGRARVLDPAQILARGWSITRDSHGGVVRGVAGLNPGAVIRTTLVDGEAASRVESVHPTNEREQVDGE